MTDSIEAGISLAVATSGWAVTPRVVDDAIVLSLRTAVAPLAVDGRGGARNLLESPAIRALASSAAIRRVACSILGAQCFATRALFFDKTPTANWKVIWHQDLTIATRAFADVPGYGPWTQKAGVCHVQPPTHVLEQMLAVRLHLDPCGTDNGPVRVLDGSHRLGRLSAEEIDELRRRQPAIDCCVEQGGLLIFRPLLVHASGPAGLPTHRRVIHLEFAALELAPPLEWHRSVA